MVGIVSGDDIRVHQPGRRAYLPLKHLLGLIGLDDLAGEHLEGDDPVHRLVLGLENPAHAAAPQLVENPVLSKVKSAGAAGEKHIRL